MYDAWVSRPRFGAARRRLLLVGLVAAVSCLLLVSAPRAAAAGTGCAGYAGCNGASYTSHGYNRTTNRRSYWDQYAGDNCTNYVAYLMIRLDGMPDRQPWSGTGNAYHWGVAESDITDSTPAVGAVAWWPSRYHGVGRLGHVAYVERIRADGTIVVSEDSYPEDGVADYSGDAYDWRHISPDSGNWPRGFIHFSRLATTSSP